MKKSILFISGIIILATFYACGNGAKSEKNKPAPIHKTSSETTDTLSNDLQCRLIIDGKEYFIDSNNITTGYTFSDSSFLITFNGINEGRVVLSVPNFFKCPCNIPTGYSSVRFKIAGTDEYSTEPTVALYNYGKADISFHNLGNGLKINDHTPKAAEIVSILKTDENTDTKWAVYLIKGIINTTVLKNVYESDAGNLNKDYKIEGGFVISAKIYY